MADELREKIQAAISLWALNGSEFPAELADEIMALVHERLDDERYYAALELRECD